MGLLVHGEVGSASLAGCMLNGRHTSAAWRLALLLATGRILGAQQPADSTITVAPAFAADRFVAAQAPIELTLSRAPAAGEGRIAVFVGTSDLTSLFEVAGPRLVFHSNGVDLPSGESELKVYLVVARAVQREPRQ